MDWTPIFHSCRLEIPKSSQQNPFSSLTQVSHCPFSSILHFCFLQISLYILFSHDSPVSPLPLPQACYFYILLHSIRFQTAVPLVQKLLHGVRPPPFLNLAPLWCFYPVVGAQFHPNSPVSSPALINIRTVLQSLSKSCLLALWSQTRHLIFCGS